jgi:hypothetical protein
MPSVVQVQQQRTPSCKPTTHPSQCDILSTLHAYVVMSARTHAAIHPCNANVSFGLLLLSCMHQPVQPKSLN